MAKKPYKPIPLDKIKTGELHPILVFADYIEFNPSGIHRLIEKNGFPYEMGLGRKGRDIKMIRIMKPNALVDQLKDYGVSKSKLEHTKGILSGEIPRKGKGKKKAVTKIKKRKAKKQKVKKQEVTGHVDPSNTFEQLGVILEIAGTYDLEPHTLIDLVNDLKNRGIVN